MFDVSFSSFHSIFLCSYSVYRNVEIGLRLAWLRARFFWITVKLVCVVSCSSFHTIFCCRCLMDECCSKIPTAQMISYFQFTVRSEFDIRHISLCITNCKRCGKMPNTCTFNQWFLQIAWSFQYDGRTSALFTISEREFIDAQ